MENLNEKDLSSLERMYAKSNDDNPTNLNRGLNTTKNTKETTNNIVYENRFLIHKLMSDITYTNMLIPAICDSIGNNIVKIGTAIAVVIASIGYLIDKLKG